MSTTKQALTKKLESLKNKIKANIETEIQEYSLFAAYVDIQNQLDGLSANPDIVLEDNPKYIKTIQATISASEKILRLDKIIKTYVKMFMKSEEFWIGCANSQDEASEDEEEVFRNRAVRERNSRAGEDEGEEKEHVQRFVPISPLVVKVEYSYEPIESLSSVSTTSSQLVEIVQSTNEPKNQDEVQRFVPISPLVVQETISRDDEDEERKTN